MPETVMEEAESPCALGGGRDSDWTGFPLFCNFRKTIEAFCQKILNFTAFFWFLFRQLQLSILFQVSSVFSYPPS